jgi:hypothetical protein
MLDFYGRDLCENKLEMGICKTLADAGLPIDYNQIALRKKDNQIADLKTRINALEDEAQSHDVAGAGSQASADHSSAVFGSGLMGSAFSWGAGKGAQSQQKDAAKARSDAASLRQQLVQLQGNDDGAKAKGGSILAAVVAGVSAADSAAVANPGGSALAVAATGVQAGVSQYQSTSTPLPDNESNPSSQAPAATADIGANLGFTANPQPQPVAPKDIPTTLTYNISFSGQGSARVVSSPPGIDCPGVCSFTWPANPSLQLTLTSTNAPGIDSSLECSGTEPAAPGKTYTCNMGQMFGGKVDLQITLWPEGGSPTK